jgi:tripartite-type tricarboxylate transporter receptor subunit TctC
VPFGTGGATDIVARVFAEAMSRPLGQTIVVDNRPGAGATIGTTAAARAPAASDYPQFGGYPGIGDVGRCVTA